MPDIDSDDYDLDDGVSLLAVPESHLHVQVCGEPTFWFGSIRGERRLERRLTVPVTSDGLTVDAARQEICIYELVTEEGDRNSGPLILGTVCRTRRTVLGH